MKRQHAPAVRCRRSQVASATQHLLEELKGRQEKLDQGMDVLNVELNKWVQAVNSQLDEATTQFTLVQKEITAQSQLSQDSQSSPQNVTRKAHDKDQIGLTDKGAYTKDTDC